MGEYLFCCLLLNSGLVALVRMFFRNGVRPFYSLNHSPRFALEYFALAVGLLLIELTIEKLFGETLCIKRRTLLERLPASFKKFVDACQEIACSLAGWYGKTYKVVNTVIFSIGLIVLIIYLNFIMQPVWGYVNYNPVQGIYKETANTIQTLFIGPSHVRNGVSPMQLYERYGIPAYNLTTSTQPMIASFYWLKEVYRRHPESLNTVVLDVSTLRREPITARYHQGFDFMHFSTDKLRAVESYSGDFTELLVNTIPLLSYHERWKELRRKDAAKFIMEPQLFLKGYHYTTSQWIAEEGDFSKIVTPVRIRDQKEKNMVLNDKAVQYFRDVADFCREHDLRLLLIKVPTNWSSAAHNAVQALANEYGLDFLDFNIEPYYSAISFNLAANVEWPGRNINNLHLNYYGATKLTDYLGKYLTEKCGARDVRGDPKYAFMDEYLEDYHRYIISAPLGEFTDPCDFIKYVFDREKYTIFISVKDDAAHALTDKQRNYFASIGLTELSNLKDGASYLAVVEDGKVMKEMTEKDPGNNVTGHPISFRGETSDGTRWYVVSSGGRNLGNTSSVKILGAERSPNKRGLNIVLYDNKLHIYVADAIFDTHAAPRRPIQNVEQRLKASLEAGTPLTKLTGVDRMLYLYNRRCDNEMKKALARNAARGNDLPSYLEQFLDDDKLVMYIVAKNDGTRALTKEARKKLRSVLPKLSEMKSRESYIAVINGGKVAEEQSADDRSLKSRTNKYLLRSAGRDSKNISTLMINGKNYMGKTNGLHVVIYDTLTQLIVDNVTFGAPQAAEEMSK